MLCILPFDKMGFLVAYGALRTYIQSLSDPSNNKNTRGHEYQAMYNRSFVCYRYCCVPRDQAGNTICLVFRLTRLDCSLYIFIVCVAKVNKYNIGQFTDGMFLIDIHFVYITYGVVFIQFHWLNQSRDKYIIFNVFFPLSRNQTPCFYF